MKHTIRWASVSCIVCGSAQSEEIYRSRQEAGDWLGSLDITLHICSNCSFVWQNPQLPPETLDRYYRNDPNASGSVFHFTGSSSKHDKKQKDRISFFSHILDRQGQTGNLLEIGCSTGEFLCSLNTSKWKLFGVEPSLRASKIAEDSGIEIIGQHIGQVDLGNDQFDSIAIFSVIEHLSNLPEVINHIWDFLKDDGALFFEIPNTLKATPQLAEFFGYEHLWHFTPTSLEAFLNKHGFPRIEYDRSVKDARLRGAAFKARSEQNSTDFTSDRSKIIGLFEHYSRDRNNLIDKIQRRLENALSGKNKIAIYGAGIHTRYLVDHYPNLIKKLIIFIDSDPKKIGTFFLGIEIVSLETALQHNLDAIIISSHAFESEILDSVMPVAEKYQCRVFTLYSNIEKQTRDGLTLNPI